MYLVLRYESHGNWSISDEFETLKEAVKYVIGNSYGSGFKIVKTVTWEVLEIEEKG